MYRTSDHEQAELSEVRSKLLATEAELAKLRNKKPLGERMSNWWYQNKPSKEFCMTTILGTILLVLFALCTVFNAETHSEIARTEAQAVQMAVEHFHSSRVNVRCFSSKDHGMLCELRHGSSKVMVRCDSETCWRCI